MDIEKKIKIAVRREIRQDCRKEALEILRLCDEKDRQDFLKYYDEDKGNICCLVLDFAKKKLVESKKWEYNENDCFNDPFKPFEEDD